MIGQQWVFSYRYPQFGGMESAQLVLPANTTVEFHVTSLDVIHSFWAYQLGVKADANPGVDNVAFTTTRNQLGSFTVRCNELCGLWHGAMFNYRPHRAARRRSAAGRAACSFRRLAAGSSTRCRPTPSPTTRPWSRSSGPRSSRSTASRAGPVTTTRHRIR